MLIDEVLPVFDDAEHHDIEVSASPARVYLAVRRLDLSSSVLVRALFFLRGLPALFSRQAIPDQGLGLTLDDLLASGFILLGERADEEIVLGVVGRFWTPTGDIRRLRPEEFAAFDEPGYAKVAWNFAIAPLAGGTAQLSTETRIRCLDDASRRRFARYWFFVRPFSGLVRRLMLQAVKQAAERPMTATDPQ
jgi:hypothetical protein